MVRKYLTRARTARSREDVIPRTDKSRPNEPIPEGIFLIIIESPPYYGSNLEAPPGFTHPWYAPSTVGTSSVEVKSEDMNLEAPTPQNSVDETPPRQTEGCSDQETGDVFSEDTKEGTPASVPADERRKQVNPLESLFSRVDGLEHRMESAMEDIKTIGDILKAMGEHQLEIIDHLSVILSLVTSPPPSPPFV